MASPDPSPTPADDAPAAFFDLDLTLLRVNSARLWLRYMWQQGEIGVGELVRSIGWLVRYKFALLDMSDITEKALRTLEGLPEDELEARVIEWYHREVADLYYAQAIEKIEEHRAAGHRLFLSTGSSPYISRLACAQLGLEDFVCTRLETDDQGRLTGRIVQPVCYNEGKLHWTRLLAQQHGVSLAHSWFYTDSFTDLPLLRAVGNPVATNPDPRLRRLARKEQIPILDFEQ